MKRVITNTQVVIIGGGCAGLSLGSKLARSPKAPSTVIIEPRTEYVEDRTWCFWDNQESQHNHLPLKSWNQVNLSTIEDEITVDLKQRRYHMLRSADFYQDKLSIIASSSAVSLQTGTQVNSVTKSPDGRWITETTLGTFISEYVIDTRPSGASIENPPHLWQTFLGLEIECDQPIFEDNIATLMDFEDVVNQDIPFVYMLPVNKNQALIELTIISPTKLAPKDLSDHLLSAISKRIGSANYRVIRKEFGAIPMGLNETPKEQDATYVRVGVTHGSARPSSGYAFCRIQQWADACCKSLINGQPPIDALQDTQLVKFMDKVFLKVLKNHPQLAPELFIRMFEQVPTARLLRFLGDKPTIADALWMVASLPKLVFLKECFNVSTQAHGSANEVICSP